MIGLPASIDWYALTLKHRQLEDGSFYRDRGMEWQFLIDKAIISYPKVWVTLPRGCGKTAQFTWWILLWLMSTSGENGIAAGADRENAAIIVDTAHKLKHLHPILFKTIEVGKVEISDSKTNSYIQIITSDAGSAFGHNASLYWFNDTHSIRSEEFFQNIYSGTGKRPGTRILVESNALTIGNSNYEWLNRFRELFKSDQTAFYYQPRNIIPSWQKDAYVEFAKVLDPSAYKRLILNEDTSDSDSFLTLEQVEACETLQGPAPPYDNKKHNCNPIVTSIDLGLTKDFSAIATVEAIPTHFGEPPRFNLLRLEAFQGERGSPVLIEEVERAAFQHKKDYGSWPIIADPWNMASSIQRHQGLMVEWHFNNAKVRALTQYLYQVIANKQLQLYPKAGWLNGWDLKTELIRAVLRHNEFGGRVDHKHSGYSDRLMAVGMCIHYMLTEVSLPTSKKPSQPKPQKLWDFQEQINDILIPKFKWPRL